MRSKLTAAFVESVKTPAQGRAEYWDARTPGFGLRVSQAGRKTWVLMCRFGGKLQRLTLGTYPPLTLADARELAKDRLADVQKGIDPAAERRRSRQPAMGAITFAALAERWLTEHARMKKRPRSVAEDEGLLRREVLPVCGTREVTSIKRADVIALVDAIAARGKGIAANRTLALLSTIFNFAVAKEVIESSPSYRVPKPGQEHSRERFLNDAETAAVWHALEAEPEVIAAFFRMALLTGQRRTELLELPWSEIDLDGGWWNLPAARSKNRQSHRIPLVGETLAILRRLRAIRQGEWVFPGARAGRPLNGVGKPLRRIIQRSGVTPFTVHDLRRTCASGLARLGVATADIAKVLNHRGSGNRVTEVYARYEFDKEKRAALIRWERRLAEIVTGESPAKVISLR